MAVIKVYQHGFSCGTAGNNKGMAGPRGEVNGWSHSAANRNTNFLQSVTKEELSGTGISFTLTLRDCPPSGDEWHRLRRSFVKRMERSGMIRLHWLTEWQRRGVPHLHGVAYFPDAGAVWQADPIEHWMQIAAPYNPQKYAQNSKPINNVEGWLKYLSKHGSRGIYHYQRSPENIPAGWKKTGRVWGHTGTWPTREAIEVQVEASANFLFRRMQKNYRISQARLAPSDTPKAAASRLLQIKAARRALAGTGSNPTEMRATSTRKGMKGWIPQGVTLRMVELLNTLGYRVQN